MENGRTRRSGNADGCPHAAGTREPRSRRTCLAASAAGLALPLLLALAFAHQETPMTYPETRRDAIAEDMFGTRIADPYRWLENDLRRDPEVAGWARAQDGLARDYLAGLPGRDAFRQRLTALFDHERLTVPRRRGNRTFFTRNTGLDAQAVLVVREGEGGHGPDHVLLDPNLWSEDGTAALGEWAVSQDGTHLAFAVQDGGSDWRTIRVLDVEIGDFLQDELTQVRFSTMAWAGDGSGFFYSRFPEPAADAAFQAPVQGHAVYFHKLGTPQSQDRLVHVTPDRPHLLHFADVTEDGRYALVTSSAGSGGNALTVLDLDDPAWVPRTVAAGLDDLWAVIGNVGTRLFLMTHAGAERGQVVILDLADPGSAPTDLVAQTNAVLNDGALVGGRLLLSYLVDARTWIERRRLDGAPDGVVNLPGPGTAGGIRGRVTDDEAFFAFTGYDTPTTILRYEAARNATTVWARPEAGADLTGIVVERRFYASKDGTRVPLFVVRRRDVVGPAPTLLTGYGGFGISLVPYYAPERIAWVEQGGVFAVANIRGGGEYGRSWHDAGRLANKQTVFDDFIAAAEHLMAEGIAAPDGLAIQGGSNGGLLVGAVVNQRPDLFATALPDVGVMDMLRFDRFTGGRYWMRDYGDPAVEADFRNLLAYSPLHNIRAGERYPAILATTAEADDRVVPGHSFKYVAALQAADLGPRPRLLRVETRAGHGAGKPTGQVIEELADLWAFAARWTGMTVKDTGPTENATPRPASLPTPPLDRRQRR